MMDEYEKWLREQVEYYREWCLESAEERGYPGKIHLADQRRQDVYESYVECLYVYQKHLESLTGEIDIMSNRLE